LPSTLFADTFHTNAPANGDGWYDVNHAYNTARQSGILAPLPYMEADATSAGGNLDTLTQVNNTGLPNTLLLATDQDLGQNSTYVSPALDFGAAGLAMQHLHVAIDPLGPGSDPAADHWAGVIFGTTPGDSMDGSGTGVLVRSSGDYEIWDAGSMVDNGKVGAKTSQNQFYTIDIAVNTGSGDFTVSINGQQLFSGNHGSYTMNYVTLEDNTDPSTSGTQVDYFDNLSITGTAQPAPVVAKANTTYYVSPNGNDNNSGTSSTSPWQTIARVNQVDFRPGDRILFQGGATFAGNLSFDSQDIGLPSSPITIGAYGTGRATISAGNSTGIAVLDAPYFTINNLQIVGSGYATNQGDGIVFTSDIPGVSVDGLTVDHVEVEGFGGVGIHFLGSNDSGDFANVAVYSASSHDNGNGGVAVDGQGNAVGIYIGEVSAYHNAGSAILESGYGIFVLGATRVVVEYSLAYDNGWLPGNNGQTGGIEAISDNLVLLQYNECYSNHQGSSDGDGIILDVTSQSIMQYNYTFNNDGAGLFLFAEIGYTSTDNVIRYNISQNDARTQSDSYGGIFVGRHVSNADIYNNTVYMGPSPTSAPAAFRILSLTGSTVHVRNNIFITTGGVPVVASDGSGTDVLFQGNDYWSGGSAPQVLWAGAAYAGLDGAQGWRANTGQEMLNGTAVGSVLDPMLVNAGAGAAISNPANLSTLAAYELTSTSPVRHTALVLSQFGIAWDPYGYAADYFMSSAFTATPEDFYGNTLPSQKRQLLSIGADQLT